MPSASYLLGITYSTDQAYFVKSYPQGWDSCQCSCLCSYLNISNQKYYKKTYIILMQKKYRLQKISENNSSRSPIQNQENSPLLKHQLKNRIHLSGLRQGYISFFKQQEKKEKQQKQEISIEEKDKTIQQLQEKIFKMTMAKTARQNSGQKRYLTILSKREFEGIIVRLMRTFISKFSKNDTQKQYIYKIFATYATFKTNKKNKKEFVLLFMKVLLFWIKVLFEGMQEGIKSNLGI